MKKICFIACLTFFSMTAQAEAPSAELVQKELQLLENSMNNRSPDKFNELLDVDTVLKVALDDLDVDENYRNGFMKGVRENKHKIITKILGLLGEYGSVKLLKVTHADDMSRGLMRLDYGDQGYGYMELHLVQRLGRVYIVDWYDYALGQEYTRSLRQIVAVSFPKPDLIGRVFDIVSNRRTISRNIVAVINLAKDRKYDELIKKYNSLGAPYKKIPIFMLLMVQTAGSMNNDDFYKQTLSDLAEFHGNNPRLGFILIDYYYYAGKYETAIKLIDNLIKEFGAEDAGMLTLKSNLLIEMDKPDRAQVLIERIIRIEPEYEDAYWRLLSLVISDKKYSHAVQVCQNLETRFGYDLNKEVMASEPAYKDFIASSEYMNWRKNNKK